MYINRYYKPLVQNTVGVGLYQEVTPNTSVPSTQVTHPYQLQTESAEAWQWLASSSGYHLIARAKWDVSRFPLSISVEASPEAELSVQQVLEWLEPWSRLSDGLVSFERHSHESEADIVIRWTTDTVSGRPYEVGHCRNHINEEGSIERSDITLVIAPAIDETLLAVDQQKRLQATLLHEVGHALGLDHTTAPADVMHHHGWKNTALTTNDIGQLRRLYQ